ncbi:MAG: hypothetical protein R2701_06455 [Acidimicrobiales bacterium]
MVLIAAGAAVLLLGTDGDASSNSPTTGPTDVSAGDDAATASTNPPATTDSIVDWAEDEEEDEELPAGDVRHFDFTYTDSEGWNYAGSFDMATDLFRFEKEIGSSPPGAAELYVVPIAASSGEVLRFDDVDEGRSGPEIHVSLGTLRYQLPADLASELSGGTPSYDGIPAQCSASLDDSGDTLELSCIAVAAFRNAALPGDPRDEAAVDAAVAALEGQAPDAILSLGDCGVRIDPTGQAEVLDSDCGAVTITETD